MKKIGWFCLIGLFVILASCGEDESSPEFITKRFVELMAAGENDSASVYGTERTKRFLDFRANSMELLGEQTIQPVAYKSVDCVRQNQQAMCTFCCDQNGETQLIPLVKENDVWLVDINVDELIKELDDAMQNLETEQQESK